MFKKLLIPAALILGLFVPLKAFAQQSPAINVSLTPIFYDLTAAPGDSVKEKIVVHNNNPGDLSLKAVIKKIAPNQSGEAAISDPAPSDDFVNWVKFDNADFVAKGQQATEVNFTINVPTTAAYGYYLAIAFQPTNTALNNNGSTVTGVPAVPILLNVKAAGAKSQGEVASFKTKDSVNETLPVEFETTFKNTGNVHLKPHGNIFIHSRSQSDLAILDVNSNLGNVLPGATRTFVSDWTDGFLVKEPVLDSNNQPIPDGKGGVKSNLAIHWDKLTHMRIGPYSASLVMAYNDGVKDQVLEASTTFWVMPYKLLGIILILIIAIVFISRKMLHSYVRSQIRKNG